MNHDAIDRGVSGIVEVKIPDSWKNASGSISYVKAEEGSPGDASICQRDLIPVNARRATSCLSLPL
jgi:pyruvate-ferredoxin/flavodoxin oxidoreductase